MALVISNDVELKLAEIVGRYPEPRSAIMPALYLGQEVQGFVSAEVMEWVAQKLGLSVAEVQEVATFYTLYHQRPVGKYHFQVCRTLSCQLAGAKPLLAVLKEQFQVAAHEVSADGLWSYEEVECLGSCGTGPTVQVNDVYFERMTPEKLTKLIGRIRAERPNLSYSTLKEELGQGFTAELAAEVVSEIVASDKGKHGAS